MTDFTPREIVSELDRHIVGQKDAKTSRGGQEFDIKLIDTVNRFIVYLLEDHFKLQDGRLAGIPDLQREAAFPYRVKFQSTEPGQPPPEPRNFHGVIPRHGVDAELVGDKQERIPRVWSQSKGLIDIWRRCSDARACFRKGSKFDDRTRVRLFHDDFGRDARIPAQQASASTSRQHLQVLVIASSFPVPAGARALDGLVRDTLGSVKKDLKQALELGKDDELRYELANVSCDPDEFSRAWLEQATRQLCRADVVFFDITEYQPLVMVLLGVRAAARRGINLLCTYEELNATFWSRLPFNVKEMYPVAIGPNQTDPQTGVAEILLDALARKKALPGYVDLPGFQLLRRGSVSNRFRRPIHWPDEILWLCSFDDAYSTATNAKTIRDKLRREFGNKIAVRRLTEIASPELASQKLFDAIRRYRLCIVDWTQLSSNVFFEFGVRLAANPRLPVCLISQSPQPAWCQAGGATEAQLGRHRAHVAWLERAFAAIPYRIAEKHDFELSEVRHRIEAMDEAEAAGPRLFPPTFGLFRYDFVYAIVAAEASSEEQGLRPPVELLKLASADILGEQGQRRLDIATLYADRNPETSRGGPVPFDIKLIDTVNDRPRPWLIGR